MKPIKSLISRLFKKKSSLGEAYLAIFLMEKGGIVHVLQKNNSGLQSTHSERFTYTNGWDHIVEDIDDVLYRLETGLGDVPDRAIFFVFSHLVDVKTREIRKSYLQKIKELVKSLDLEALGYIEAREAAVEYIQHKKRTPPSMILLEIDSEIASLFIYHNGQVAFHKQLDGVDMIQQSIISTLTEIKPQISLPQDIVIYSHSDSASDKLGELNINFDKDLYEVKPHIEIIDQQLLESGLINLFSGQVAGTQAPAVVHADAEQDSAEAMGFVIGGDIEDNGVMTEEIIEEDEVSQSSAVSTGTVGMGGAFSSKARGMLTAIKGVRMPKVAMSHSILAIVGVALIIISLGALEFFFHKATVVVTMPSQKLEKELELTNKDIELQQATSSAQYNESKKATGTKTIGEKAKGSVTIYNSSLTGSKSLSSGSTITGPGGLTFALDDSVSIASAEGDASAIKASTKDVSVTASAIGSEYNISADNKFAIDGQSESEVIAKNSGAFSGGSKESITIVSSADVEALKKLATEKIKKQKPSEDSTENIVAIPQLSSVVLDDVTTTPDLSEEAETVELKATGLMQSFYFDGAELKKVIGEKLKSEVESGYVIKPSDITQTVKSATRSKTASKVVLDVRVRATPTVDLSSVAPALVAKGTAGAESALREKFKAREAEIQVTHPIGIFNSWLPLRKENITVDIRFQDQ